MSDLRARRLFLTATTILWGNATFDTALGLGRSSDGNGYTVKNAQYAAALLDALADRRDVDLPAAEATRRANAILARICASARSPATAAPPQIPRHSGRGAPPLTRATGGDDLLAVLAHLERHRDRLGVTPDVRETIREVLPRLYQAHADRIARQGRRAGSRSRPRPTPPTAAAWLSAVERTAGVPLHWSDVTPYDVEEFLDEPGGFQWPIPIPRCDTLQPCERITCYVKHYIPTKFFKGAPAARPLSPVVLVAGWQVQFRVHTGSGAFGDEASYATHPPSPAPSGNNQDHDIPPPVYDVEVGLPDHRTFHGLGTMLRCAAGYDYVTWGQSHPGGPIQDSVNELRAVIDATKHLYGVPKVVLACHSRGGLIARKCIVDLWKAQLTIDVEKLITYGTPHLGAALATVGEDVLAEAIPGLLLAALLAEPAAVALPAEILDVIGQLFGPSAESHLESQILQLATPLVSAVWPNFKGFVASGEEMRPDSLFIQALNNDYNTAAVVINTQELSLWQAIDTVLIAGTSPDFLTIYLGSWLDSLSYQGLTDALAAQTGTTTVEVGGVEITTNTIYFPWQWHWYPLIRVVSDIIPLIPELSALDTFKEGLGDSIVERSSALATGVAGVRRAEFQLQHFNLKANNDRASIYSSPVGLRSVYPWQVLFLELGLDPTSGSTACSAKLAGCGGFDMSSALG